MQSDIVTIGEVRSTADKWGRKAILLGIGLKECIVVYERYVQGDEGFEQVGVRYYYYGGFRHSA